MGQRTEVFAPDYEGDCTAVISYWYKRVGDRVARGTELVDYETDKATVTLEADTDGVLVEICVPEDTAIHPGQRLGVIESDGSEG